MNIKNFEEGKIYYVYTKGDLAYKADLSKARSKLGVFKLKNYFDKNKHLLLKEFVVICKEYKTKGLDFSLLERIDNKESIPSGLIYRIGNLEAQQELKPEMFI